MISVPRMISKLTQMIQCHEIGKALSVTIVMYTRMFFCGHAEL